MNSEHGLLTNLVYLYERQGRFKGDLNVVQASVLNWIIYDEAKRKAEVKKQDYEIMALTGNERTNIALIEYFQKENKPPEEQQVEWITPQSEEDLQEILSTLGQLEA